MSPRAVVVRILTVLHSALGRWLAQAEQLQTRKGKRTSWFDAEPGTLKPPRSADEEDVEAAWYRAHFKINGQPLP